MGHGIENQKLGKGMCCEDLRLIEVGVDFFSQYISILYEILRELKTVNIEGVTYVKVMKLKHSLLLSEILFFLTLKANVLFLSLW